MINELGSLGFMGLLGFLIATFAYLERENKYKFIFIIYLMIVIFSYNLPFIAEISGDVNIIVSSFVISTCIMVYVAFISIYDFIKMRNEK